MQIPDLIIHEHMERALECGRAARARGEVPVGAVVAQTPSWEVIAAESNRVEELKDASAHAELLALRSAAARLGAWRLQECALWVTLEPCTMCLGAIRLFRVPIVIFGARDPTMGACGSLYDLSCDDRWGVAPPRVVSGVMAPECQVLMEGFFSDLRCAK